MSDEEVPPYWVRLQTEHDRLQTAYKVACFNVTELTDQRTKLTDALNTALFLLDQLLTEMRLANVTPSAGIIVSRADLDRAMRKLFGRDRPQEDS